MRTRADPDRRPSADVRARGWIERWWRGDAGVAGRVLDVALAPAEALYRAAVRLRTRAYATGLARSRTTPVPVLSIGNISVGGAGKTPVTRWLVGELRRRGATPAVLHGGYAPDEPALHRAWHPEIPVVADRDRVAGAGAAIAAGATVLLLDDGFQHRRLDRDVDLVLVAAESWTRAPRLLPRGPWREPPAALERATVVAVTRKAAEEDQAIRVAAELARWTGPTGPVRFHLRPTHWRRVSSGTACPRPPSDAIAVAGVAYPEHFLANARTAGATWDQVLVFRDHFRYDAAAVARIRAAAGGRPVVTTAKDAVKLALLDPELDLWILEQEVIVEAGAERVARLLDELVV